MNTICGLDCGDCHMRGECGGCIETGGKPFGGDCMLALCCAGRGQSSCGQCGGRCYQKMQLVEEFNALGIEDMEKVTDLNALKGEYINLSYTLPGGETMRFWKDNRCYLGNQLHKKGTDKCYGLTADENHLLVCEYGENGSDPEIVLYKRREK